MKYLISTLIIVMLFACEKQLTLNEYYARAKKSYSEQKIYTAVDDFKLILKYYPDDERISDAIFMLGFINANDMKNLDEAKKYYKLFIEKFPDHELANSARYELENLGKDINELPIFKDEVDSTTEISAQN